MDVGTLFVILLLLIGLTIQTGLSWWWWLAAFVIGTVVNIGMREGVKLHVKRKWRRERLREIERRADEQMKRVGDSLLTQRERDW